jgi:hypothetical protein
MRRAIEEDRLVLHELRGVNLKVDFFLGTRKELLDNSKCIAYSICWKGVDVRIDLITFTEQLSELDFYFSAQQLFIDDHIISGDVIDFHWEVDETGLIIAYCKILIGRE